MAGRSPDVNLLELWRRIVFNMAVTNTDDHLRKSRIYLDEKWLGTVQPSYDVNPVPYGDELSLNVDDAGHIALTEILLLMLQ